MKFKDGDPIKFSFEFSNPIDNSKELIFGYGIIVGVIPKSFIVACREDVYLVEVGDETKAKLNIYDYDYRVLPVSESLITEYGNEIQQTSEDIQTR